MNNELIQYLKDFLSKNNLDGLIINSTNEFLVEYNMLDLNSRYYVTGFTGSTGDVLFTNDKIYLFVDTRYHEQADLQVDSSIIEVVKMPLSMSFLTALTELITPYSKLGIIAQKTSKKFYDALVNNLKEKSSTIKLINSDPVIDFEQDKIKNVEYKVFEVSKDIAGCSPDEKFDIIKQYIEGSFNVLVTSLEDIAYLTNLRSYSFDYSAIFPAKAIINQDVIKIFSDCKLPYIGKNFEVLPFSYFSDELKSIENQDIFIDESQITIYDYNLINKNNNILRSHISLFKTVKNECEINHMKSCFERADNALKIIDKMLQEEKEYSEYDYYEALVKSMYENGALSLSFKPIVAGGSNTSIIHYSMPSKDKIIKDGDMLLVDYGGYYEGGLATDTTRTFIKGTPSQEQKMAYTTVLKAFLNAYSEKYNKKSSYYNIDKIARDTIEKTISDDYKFAHSTGHGVGISVHEIPPRVSSSEISKTKILEHTVFSIEPGVYKEGWGGIRLENTVYASYEEDKVVMNSFSKFPFELKMVDFSMLTETEKWHLVKWQKNTCEI